jgi:hypothetical protein
MKIRQLGAELFNAGRRTDINMAKQIVAFSNSAFAPKTEQLMCFETNCLHQTADLTKTLRNKLLLHLFPNSDTLKIIQKQ